MNVVVEQAPLGRRLSRELPDDAPIYCPLCGRYLEYAYWTPFDGGYRYEAFTCYAGRPRWRRWIERRIALIWPSGQHYRYEFGPTREPIPRLFDSLTGERKAERNPEP